MILVIPAIDLHGGHFVRLQDGLREEEQTYFADPVKMARLWRVQNARTLHLIDLDGAQTAGARTNRAVIEQIAGALDVPIEVGGGVRTMDDIEELFEMGVYRVVIGTSAVREPGFVEEAVARFSASRVVVGIDVRDEQVCVDARETTTDVDFVDFGLAMEARGVRRIVLADVEREGSLDGPNLEASRTLARQLTSCRVTVAGGVRDYRDLLRLQELEPLGVDSAIVGKALYENRFPCQQFWTWHRKDLVDLDIFSTAELADSEAIPDRTKH